MKNKTKNFRFISALLICLLFLCSCASPVAVIGKSPNVIADDEEMVQISLLSVTNNTTDEKSSASSKSYEIIPTSLLDILSQPNSLIETEDDALLITDLYNRVIWKVKDGKSEIYAGFSAADDLYGQPVGGYNDSTLEQNAFKEPWAIAPFLDGYAVSDTKNNVIRLIRQNDVETLNPHSETGVDTTQIDHPTGLAADDTGNLYVAETFLNRIRKISPDGVIINEVLGVSEPTGLYMKDGVLYIAESGANRISMYKDGKLTVLAGSGESGFADGPAAKAEFSSPQGITVADDGTIYVADTANSAVRIIKDGNVSTLIARDLTDINEFFPIEPTGLLISDNLLYVCDPYARKLLAVYI